MAIPSEVAGRLAGIRSELRTAALRRQMHEQALECTHLSNHEVRETLTRYSAAKQVVLRRVLDAVERGDVDTAEEQLDLALSYAARVAGCTRAQAERRMAA